MKSMPVLLTMCLLTLALPGARAMEEITDLVIDFGSAASVEGWIAVNDGVMGGKSEGGFVLQDDHLVFSGVLNTDGGGFSSIRGPLPAGSDLGTADGVLLRVRATGTRRFDVDFRQQEPGRSRPLSYRADIPLDDLPD